MALPNTQARRHGQGTPGTRSLPRINKLPPKYYAPTAPAFPITSGGTTAIAKGGHTPPDNVGGMLVCSLSFATPLAVSASNSVSFLSQSTKEMAGKRDGSSIAKSFQKRMRREPLYSGARDNDAPLEHGYEDKEPDYVPICHRPFYLVG